MNENIYRLVVDVRTGTLVPVAEFTRGAKKNGIGASTKGRGAAAFPRALSLMLLLACYLPGSVFSQVVPDAAGGAQRPTVSTTANDTPLINITDPNANGLSHNKFSQFNVSDPGVVFNNSQADGVSQLGGYAMKNPNLSRSATGILVDVTGSDISRLQGALEVFGPGADLLISNQNGLYVNGVATINVNNLLLTTGRVLADGTRYEVGGGHIDIAGPVNTHGLGYFDVVARSIAVNDAITGDAQIKLAAGLNAYQAGTREVDKIADGAAGAPQLAISGSEVGAMHGSRVQLISTESGLGVRHAGVITSRSDIQISVDGDLEVKPRGAIVSTGALQVSAKRLGNEGELASGQDLVLQAERLDNADSGQLHAGRSLDVRVGQAHNAGYLGSVEHASIVTARELDNRGELVAGGDLHLRLGRLQNQGSGAQVWSSGQLSLTTTGDAVNAEGAQLGGSRLELEIGQALRNQNAQVWGNEIGLRAGSVFNQAGASIQADGGLSLRVSGELLNSEGATLYGTKAASVWSQGTLLNDSGAFIGSLGALELSAGGDVLNRQGASIEGGQVKVAAVGAVDNQAGLINASEALQITADSLRNRDAGQVYGHDVDLTIAGAVSNESRGSLWAGNRLTLTSSTLLNQNASLGAVEALRITASHLRNLDAGELFGRDIGLTIAETTSNASGASIMADERLSIATGALRNENATLWAESELDIGTAGELINRDGGVVASEGTVRLDAKGQIENTGANSRIVAEEAYLSADGTLHNTDQGQIQANELQITTGSDLNNHGGALLQGLNGLSAQVGGALRNSGADTRILGGSVDLQIEGEAHNSEQALLQGANELSLRAQRLVNSNARLLSGAVVAVENGGAPIAYAGDMALDLREGLLNTQGGRITSLGHLWIDTRQTISGEAGDVENAGDAKLEADGLLEIQAANLRNAGAISSEQVGLYVRERLNNSGQITGGSQVYADSTDLVNTGTIQAKDLVELETDTFANTNKIYTAGDAVLTIKNGHDLTISDAVPGVLAGENSLTLNADDVRIDRELANPGHIIINATGTIDNATGLISGKSIFAKAGNSFTNHDLIWAAQDVDIQAHELRNRAGAEIEATRDLSLDVDTTVTNEAGARIAAGRDVFIEAAEIKNQADYTGSVVVKEQERGNGTYHYDHALRSDKYEFFVGQTYDGSFRDEGNGLAVLESGVTLGAQGMIEAGRTLSLSGPRADTDPAGEGEDAVAGVHLLNEGQLLAGGSVYVNGDIDNVGFGQTESIEDYLQRSGYFEIKASVLGKTGKRTYATFYDLLDGVFSSDWHENLGVAGLDWHADRVVNSLKAYSNPQFNAVMSLVFGPEWRSASFENTLIPAWAAFKADIANKEGFSIGADKGAQIAAGGNVVHTGGYLKNGDGAQYKEQTPVTVDIGEQEVETIGGQFDTVLNPGELGQGLDPSQVWGGLIEGNRRFQPNPSRPDYEPVDWSLLAPVSGPQAGDAPAASVVPLYETRIEFIDQSQFYGSDYFFRQVGYVSDRPVPVIGDAYFIHELVTRQINQQVGGFLTIRDHVSGADLVKLLLDNAGEEGSRLGLRVGVAPTPEQLAHLDQDIIWFEEAVVNGQRALVPKVYLTSQTVADVREGRAAGAASLEAGESVTIDADERGAVNSNGAIRAGKSIVITSEGGVTNVSDNGRDNAGLKAGEDLFIDAKGDVTNIGSDIEGGRDVVVRTKGDFTDSVRTRYDEKGNLIIGNRSTIRGGGVENVVSPQDAVSAVAIEKTRRALPETGSVTIVADGNVNLAASDIRAQDVLIKAGKDLNVQDVHEVSSSFEQSRSSGFLTQSSTTTEKADAQSVGSAIYGGADGGSLVLLAGQDITLQGGQYGADQGLIKAGGDVITKTGQDVSHTRTHTVSQGLTVGVRLGLGGAAVEASYGPEGASTSVVGFDGNQQNPTGGAPNAGGPANQAGKSALGESIGAQIGYKRVEVIDTHDTVTNHNAQLNFGKSVTVIADDTVDVGGSDIRANAGGAKGDILIQGGEVISTKYEDVDRQDTVRRETFVGVTSSVQSSVLDAVNKSKALADATKDGQTVDPGLTTAQAVGDATNLVFNDAIGSSTDFKIKHTEERSSETTRKENINTIDGNIAIVATQGDINLAGVVLDGRGAGVSLEAAQDIELTSAKTRLERETSRQTHEATAGISLSVAPTGAGTGASVGYSGEHETGRASDTKHENSQILASDVQLKSGNDLTLKGAEVKAGRLGLEVGGDLRVESVQDTHEERSERATWGASVGVAVTTQSPALFVAPTVSANGGYGQSWDNSAKTASQSGLQAGTLDVKVDGDVALKGGHLIAEEGGSWNVGGKVISEELKDFRDKDGFFGGGGGGISRSGLASVDIQLERDEQIHYQSEQLNTVSLPGQQVRGAGGVVGAINTDASQTEKVLRDQHIAGNSVSVTVGVGDIQEGVSNRKKNNGHDGGADTTSVTLLASTSPAKRPALDDALKLERLTSDAGVEGLRPTGAERPSSQRDPGTALPDRVLVARPLDGTPDGVEKGGKLRDGLSKPDVVEVTAVGAPPPVETRAGASVDGEILRNASEQHQAERAELSDSYDSRIVVDLGNDPHSHAAAERLAAKHPDNTVLVKPDANGRLNVLSGTPSQLRGQTKVQVVGHGEGAGSSGSRLGGKDASELATEVAGVKAALEQQSGQPLAVAKVALVGCDSGACANEDSSLASQTAQALQGRGVETTVKGYAGRIDVTPEGRKYPVEQGGLMKEPADGGETSAGASAAKGHAGEGSKKPMAEVLQAIQQLGPDGIRQAGGLPGLAKAYDVKYNTLKSLVSKEGVLSADGQRKVQPSKPKKVSFALLEEIQGLGPDGIQQAGGLPELAKVHDVSYGTLKSLIDNQGVLSASGQRKVQARGLPSSKSKPLPVSAARPRDIPQMGEASTLQAGGSGELAKAPATSKNLITEKGVLSKAGKDKVQPSKSRSVRVDAALLEEIQGMGPDGIRQAGGLKELAKAHDIKYKTLKKDITEKGILTGAGKNKILLLKSESKPNTVGADLLRKIQGMGPDEIQQAGGLGELANDHRVSYGYLSTLITEQGILTKSGKNMIQSSELPSRREKVSDDLLKEIQGLGPDGIQQAGGLEELAKARRVSYPTLSTLITEKGVLTTRGEYKVQQSGYTPVPVSTALTTKEGALTLAEQQRLDRADRWPVFPIDAELLRRIEQRKDIRTGKDLTAVAKVEGVSIFALKEHVTSRGELTDKGKALLEGSGSSAKPSTKAQVPSQAPQDVLTQAMKGKSKAKGKALLKGSGSSAKRSTKAQVPSQASQDILAQAMLDAGIQPSPTIVNAPQTSAGSSPRPGGSDRPRGADDTASFMSMPVWTDQGLVHLSDPIQGPATTPAESRKRAAKPTTSGEQTGDTPSHKQARTAEPVAPDRQVAHVSDPRSSGVGAWVKQLEDHTPEPEVLRLVEKLLPRMPEWPKGFPLYIMGDDAVDPIVGYKGDREVEMNPGIPAVTITRNFDGNYGGTDKRGGSFAVSVPRGLPPSLFNAVARTLVKPKPASTIRELRNEVDRLAQRLQRDLIRYMETHPQEVEAEMERIRRLQDTPASP